VAIGRQDAGGGSVAESLRKSFGALGKRIDELLAENRNLSAAVDEKAGYIDELLGRLRAVSRALIGRDDELVDGPWAEKIFEAQARDAAELEAIRGICDAAGVLQRIALAEGETNEPVAVSALVRALAGLAEQARNESAGRADEVAQATGEANRQREAFLGECQRHRETADRMLEHIQAERNRADALRNYALHKSACAVLQTAVKVKCTCGLSALLDAPQRGSSGKS